MGIHPQDVLIHNPFFSEKNTKQAGCPIDYMIQTKHHVVYVCEIKLTEKEMGISVIDEVKEKVRRLKLPKNHSCSAVLIHCNGVTDQLLDQQYFSNIIDVSEWLN